MFNKKISFYIFLFICLLCFFMCSCNNIENIVAVSSESTASTPLASAQTPAGDGSSWKNKLFNISFPPPPGYLMITAPQQEELAELTMLDDIINKFSPDTQWEMLAVSSLKGYPFILAATQHSKDFADEKAFLRKFSKNGEDRIDPSSIAEMTFYTLDTSTDNGEIIRYYVKKSGDELLILIIICNQDTQADADILLSMFNKAS